MTSPRVLICGASVAGPALAYWLGEYGWETTVVERTPQLRAGGQSVDVRGAGREVVRRMGLEGAIREKTTGEAGVNFVDPDNRTMASFPATALDGDGPVAELEILRGQLAELLVDSTKGRSEYIFGDQVVALDQRDDRVTVDLEHGGHKEFDLVIAADGKGSRTRSLVLADETRFRSLGVYTSWFTIDRAETDRDWARWYNAPGGLTVTLRPDNVGTTRAALTMLARQEGQEDLDPAQQQEMLQEAFGDAGWETQRALDGMLGASDFYFEETGQIMVERWSSGRVALVGDAACCPSPISGMGTSLALVGAYVLAGELATRDNHSQAFAAYEEIMRPYVAQAQKLPPGAPRLAIPRTRAGIRVLNTSLRLASSSIAQRIGSRFLSPPDDAIDLPDYGDRAGRP